jgi:YVTN family beta-propeller protein
MRSGNCARRIGTVLVALVLLALGLVGPTAAAEDVLSSSRRMVHVGGHQSDGERVPSTNGALHVDYDAVYVVNGGSNTLSVLNATTGEIAGTVTFQNARYPHHAALSPDRSKLVVAVPGMDLSRGHGGHGPSSAQGLLMVLDAQTGATLKWRRLDAPNHNGIFSPDGTEIWTSQMKKRGSVLVLDAGTLELRNEISVGDMPAEVTFARDGNHAFVANGMSNTVTVLDAATKAVKGTISVGAGPVGAWPGANNVMYVDNESGKTITAIDAATMSVVHTYDLGFTPAMAATAPNDELWVTDTDNGKVVILMTTRDHNKIGEVVTGAGAHGIVVSHDNATAYVTNQSAGTLSIINVGAKTARSTVTVGSKPNGVVFRKH